MSDSVSNWESTIQKTVRSSEGNLIGNVDAVDENSILVSTEGGRTRYNINNTPLMCYDACQNRLNLSSSSDPYDISSCSR
jgi:hypothetical protein